MTAKTHGAFGNTLRWTAVGLAGAALMALAACEGPPAPQTSAPQPTPEAAAPPASTPLLGAPPADAGPAPPEFHPMAPIANPEDMSDAERVKVYGHRYDHRHGHHGHHAGERHHHHAHGQAAPGAAQPAHPTAHRAHHAHAAAQQASPAHPAAPHAVTPAPKPHPAPAAAAHAPAAQAPAEHKHHHHRRDGAQPSVSSAEQDGAAASGGSSAQAESAAASGAPNRLNADWLTIPGAPTLDVPGFGKVPSKTVVAIGLLLLALLILGLAIRGAPARKPKPAAKSEYRATDIGGGDEPPKT